MNKKYLIYFLLKKKVISMNLNDKIYVAGHRGMVGSAIVRALEKRGHENFVFKSHNELDLTVQTDVQHFFNK